MTSLLSATCSSSAGLYAIGRRATFIYLHTEHILEHVCFGLFALVAKPSIRLKETFAPAKSCG
jgi:hypothetical protein